MEYSKTKLPFVSGRKYNNLLKDISDNWDKIRVFFKEIDADKYFTF